MNRRDGIKALGAAAMAAALPSWPSFGQAKYPDRPVRVIVPYAPGGVVDVMARHWAQHVKSALGSVVIENQGGGGGTLGASAVARAQPDGYTLLFGDTSSQIIAPSLMATPPYDPVDEFRRNLDHCHLDAGYRRAPERAGEGPRRTHQVCAGQQRQAVLRIGRCRHRRQSGG